MIIRGLDDNRDENAMKRLFVWDEITIYNVWTDGSLVSEMKSWLFRRLSLRPFAAFPRVLTTI